MIFWNLNNLSLVIFISLLILWWFFLRSIYKKENTRLNIVILFLSFLFLIINIFEIKWWFNSKNEIIEWWKIVFVLDVSKSMNAADIKNNNNLLTRFDTSKWIIDFYISKYLENNYGLIIFAWEALETLPFTNDSWVFKTVLHWVNNWNLSKYWTNLNSVFNSLHNYFTWDDDWWLAVIFTDWWDEEIEISNELIDSLQKKRIKLLLVWVGSVAWWKIQTWNDFFWRAIYKTYNWEEVITKLNNKVLNNISSKFDIWYIYIDDTSDISKINTYITKNINLVNVEKNINYRTDFTRLFTFISFCFFILYLFLNNFPWRKK